jgi:DNA-binding MarR family transcriptional regulator
MPKVNRSDEDGIGAAEGLSPAESFVHEQTLGFQIRLTWETMRMVIQERMRANGVRFAYWTYLRVLWTEDGITQRELSERVRRVGANTVSALNAMQSAGLVRRERSEVDRRSMHVYLTPEGKALERKLIPVAATIQRQATANISDDDLATFMRVLATIRENLESTPAEKLDTAHDLAPSKG